MGGDREVSVTKIQATFTEQVSLILQAPSAHTYDCARTSSLFPVTISSKLFYRRSNLLFSG